MIFYENNLLNKKMINEKNPLLKLKHGKNESVIIGFYNNIIESIYALFDLMLDDSIENFCYECINIVFGYNQI